MRLAAPVPPGAPEDAAQAFLAHYAAAFGIYSPKVAFSTKRIKTSGLRTYVHLRQEYASIPVFGAETMVQLDDQNGVQAVINDISVKTAPFDAGQIPLKPTVYAPDAEAKALENTYLRIAEEATAVGTDLTKEELSLLQTGLNVASPGELVIYDPPVVGEEGEPALAWMMDITAPEPFLFAERMLFDAHTGDLLFGYSLIHDAKYRDVCDCDNASLCVGFHRVEDSPPLNEPDQDNAYDILGAVYDFYNDANFGFRDSYDDNGSYIIAKARYFNIIVCGSLFPPCDNAMWTLNDLLVIGDGLAVDDILAHEFTHGVTNYESGLVYANESGAINESLSDVFGEIFDLTYGSDPPGDRWLMGEDSRLGALRDMADPPSMETVFGPYPDRYDSPNFYTGTEDKGGVHINSSVNNKLCYLLVDGDTFRGRTIDGMGIDQVAALYYECQVNLLGESSDYYDLHAALTQAAINLSWTTTEKSNLETACRAV